MWCCEAAFIAEPPHQKNNIGKVARYPVNELQQQAA
jgi:hypothetical protein